MVTYSVRRLVKNYSLLEFLNLEIFPADDCINFKDCLNWIVLADGDPVGFSSMKILQSEDAAFLERAGVMNSFRGQGLHNRLIKVRINAARKLGLSCIITYIKRSNPASGNNLIDNGFHLYEPQTEWADEECIYFMLDLSR